MTFLDETDVAVVSSPRDETQALVPPQQRSKPALDGLVIFLFDVAVALAATVAWSIRMFGRLHVPLGVIFVLGLPLLLNGLNGIYRRPRVALSALGDMKQTVLTAATPLVFVGVAMALEWTTPRMVKLAALMIPVYAASRVFAYWTIRMLRRRGSLIQPAVIVGRSALNERLISAFMTSHDLGLRVIGYVDNHPGNSQVPWLGKVEDLDRVLQTHGVRRLLVGFSEQPDSELVPTLRELQTRPLEVFIVPRLYEWGSASGDMRTQHCAGTPIVWLAHREWRWEQLAMKRASDLIMATAIIILSSPVFIATALAAKLTSRGPVFFRQKRVGRDGVVFEMLKFRSMRHDPNAVHTLGGGGDPRITKVDAFIRRTWECQIRGATRLA